MIIETNSAEETFAAGFRMGQQAVPGEIISLDGDLGVGKTVFTQGFAKGLGITEPVNSPTFTIIQVYEEGRLPLYHFDVYRISDSSEMDEIGYEEYFYAGGQTADGKQLEDHTQSEYAPGVCLVEWGSMIEDLLPEQTIHVKITKNLEKGFDYRRIAIEEAVHEDTCH